MKTIYTCFPGGLHKALTLSYDDGRSADRRLVGILNDHGIRGTFHLNAGLLGSGDRVPAEEVASLYAGHEVSAHTLTHPTIARCPREQVALQILEDRRRLEDIVGYTVRGMSYPNGSFDREIVAMLPALGIEYARVVETTGGFGMPEDLLVWKTTCHHNHDLLKKAGQFVEFSKKQYLCWLSVWGHSYEFDNDGNWDLIERFSEAVGKRDDVWYVKAIAMVDYMAAARRLTCAVSGDFAENPSAVSVWLSVDGRIVEVPPGSRVGLG